MNGAERQSWFEQSRGGIAAVAAFAIAIGGLYEVPRLLSPGSDLGKSPAIPRCFDKPLPKQFHAGTEPKMPNLKKTESWQSYKKAMKQYSKADKKWWDRQWGKLPALKIPVYDGFAQGDPIYKPRLEDQADKAIVRIENKEWDGSGFLTTDGHGREVVVTAAHVVDDAKLKGLTITANNGASTHPIGGCYIMEDNGHFKSMPKNESGYDEYDLAVLRLAKPIGQSTLKLSLKPVYRGQWVYFDNFQGFHEPGNPANYTGVVVSRPTDALGFNVLTGARKLDVPITVGEQQDNIVVAGASGGPVTDLHGNVIGISIAADKNGLYEGAGDLKSTYGVTLPGAKFGPRYGFAPNTGQLVPSSIIAKALESRRG